MKLFQAAPCLCPTPLQVSSQINQVLLIPWSHLQVGPQDSYLNSGQLLPSLCWQYRESWKASFCVFNTGGGSGGGGGTRIGDKGSRQKHCTFLPRQQRYTPIYMSQSWKLLSSWWEPHLNSDFLYPVTLDLNWTKNSQYLAVSIATLKCCDKCLLKLLRAQA